MRKCKLGKLLDVTRGVSLVGAHCASKGERVRLTLANFDYVNNCFQEDHGKDNLFYTKEVPKRFILEAGSIITPLTEQTPGLLGSTARIPDSGKYIQSQDVGLVTPFEDLLDDNFAYYLVSSKGVKDQLAARSQQTKIRHTSPDKIKDCTVFVPDLPDQRKIGKFLSWIDRLIGLSRKRVGNLEKLAKEIYDYWFVQFDFPDKRGKPYKTSGGKMVYNVELKREIPAGWKVGALTDIAVFTNGLACQRFRPRPGESSLPVLKIKEMHGGITDKTEKVRENIPERYKVYDGDVVFSWSASLEVMIWAHGRAGLNQHIFKVTEKNGWPLYYSYLILGDYVETFRKIAESRKTTMGHITSDHLKMSRVPLPADMDIASRFERLVSPIFGAWVKSSQLISELSRMREFLLPLLMNGQAKLR